MSSLLVLAALVAAAFYFGWSALGALRSGEVSLYLRANRVRWYRVLAVVCASLVSSFAHCGNDF
jgi:hypothetical protein